VEQNRAPSLQLHHHQLARPAADHHAHHHRADLGHLHQHRAQRLAEYDPNWYPKGVKITDKQLAALPLVPHEFHGEWNYTLNAQSDPA
jgi:hypothetical protein